MKFLIILEELFYAMTILLVLLSGLELLWSKSVLAFLNINLVLIIWLIIGILNVTVNNKIHEK